MNRNSKSIIICMLLIGVVFISGCAQQQAEEVEEDAFYVGGLESLDIRFVEGQPPVQFFEGDDVEVVIQLDNKGEYTIPIDGASIEISGIPPSARSSGFTSSLNNNEELPGVERVDVNILPGGFEELYFGELNYDLNVPPGTPIPQKIFAKACYLYGTKATAKACIKENIYTTTTGTQICEVNEEKKVEASSGPIEVTSVSEVGRGPNKISVTISLKNSGGGDVYWNNESVACDNVEFSNLNRLKVRSVEIDELGQGDCKGLGADGETLRLDPTQSTASFVCDWDTAGEDTYEGFLEIELEYKYTTDTIKSLEVISTA